MRQLLVLALAVSGLVTLIIPKATIAQPSFAVDKGSTLILWATSFQNMSGDLYERENKSQKKYTFTPFLAYFVVPNFSIGADVSISTISLGDADASDVRVGPKVLYAFGSHESTIYPYLTAGFNYLDVTNDNGTDSNGTKFKFGAGVIFMPAGQQHLGITVEAGIHLDSMKADTEGAESISGTQIEVSMGLAGLLF